MTTPSNIEYALAKRRKEIRVLKSKKMDHESIKKLNEKMEKEIKDGYDED